MLLRSVHLSFSWQRSTAFIKSNILWLIPWVYKVIWQAEEISTFQSLSYFCDFWSYILYLTCVNDSIMDTSIFVRNKILIPSVQLQTELHLSTGTNHIKICAPHCRMPCDKNQAGCMHWDALSKNTLPAYCLIIKSCLAESCFEMIYVWKI